MYAHNQLFDIFHTLKTIYIYLASKSSLNKLEQVWGNQYQFSVNKMYKNNNFTGDKRYF